MSYLLHSFDGLTLPAFTELRWEEGVDPGFITLAGGRVWNPYRGQRVLPKMMKYEMDCVLDSGSEIGLMTAYNALRAKNGVTGTLVRVDPSVGTTGTVTATAVIPQVTRDLSYSLQSLAVPVSFVSTEWPWRGADRSTSITITGTSITPTVSNSGNAPWLSPVITVTAGNVGLVGLTFRAGPDSEGRQWYWGITGTTVAAGKALVIDCGANTILNDGAAAYAGFFRYASHNQDRWAEVPVGGFTFNIQVSKAGAGTDPTLTWTTYDGWGA